MLYVLVPVLVHVLLDGSGHDSAEIDGTRVERHATSAPTKQPVPAPRHSTRSSIKTDFHLDLADTPYSPKTSKPRDEESRPVQGHHFSPDKNSPTSKIPVRVKKSAENGRGSKIEFDDQRSLDFATTRENGGDEDGEFSLGEKEARQPEEDKERSDSSLKSEPSNETHETATIIEETCCSALPIDEHELVKRTETAVIGGETRDRSSFDESTREISSRVDKWPIDSKPIDERGKTREEVVRTVVTTVRCATTVESYVMDRSERMAGRLERGNGVDYDVEQASGNMIKSDTELSEPWAQASLSDRSFPNDEKVEQWESQLSQDTSPGSGNGDIYTKNGSSRHDLNSDTDSDGSPRSRRRSPSKRCTLGSSSGSDVALHEGAELSPLEDDQGTALTANLLSKQCTYPAKPTYPHQTETIISISKERLMNSFCGSLYRFFLLSFFLSFFFSPCTFVCVRFSLCLSLFLPSSCSPSLFFFFHMPPTHAYITGYRLLLRVT